MSIKSLFLLRFILSSAVIACVLGVGALAFGPPDAGDSIFSLLRTVTAAGMEAKVAAADDKKTSAKKATRSGGTAAESIIFAEGNLPIDNTLRRDHLQSIDPNGGTPSSLTNIDDLEPSWSYEGDKVVFVSLRDGPDVADEYDQRKYRELYIMNPDGSNQQRLGGQYFGAEYEPSFSRGDPNGPIPRKIVFAADYSPAGQESGIYTVDEYGQNLTLVTNGNSCQPFIGKAEKRSKSTTGRRIGSPYYDRPNFSPDGTKILFSMADYSENYVWGIFEFDLTNGGCREITGTTQGNEDIKPSAVYSPDGSQIVFYDAEQAGQYSTHTLYVADTNSGMTLRQYQPLDLRGYPTWSPDGSEIAYLSGFYDVANDTDVMGTGIRKMNVEFGYDEDIYQQSVPEGIRGFSWGTPSGTVLDLTMRINSPNPVTAGTSTTGTVYLAQPAPPGGYTVELYFTNAPIGIVTLPSSTLTIPEGATEGVFTVDTAIRLDYRSADIAATHPSPNYTYASATVSVEPSKADLRADSFTAPSNAAPGTNVEVSWSVTNIGPVTTGSPGGRDAVYLSEDTTFGPEDGLSLTAQNGATLAAGATRTANSVLVIPTNRIQAARQYYLIFVTNSDRQVPESQFGNNTIVRPIQVDLPDLIVENLLVPAITTSGVTTNVSWRIRNQGSIAAQAASNTRLYYSDDAIFGNSDDIQLGTVITAALAGGAFVDQNLNVKVPTVPLRPDGTGTYFIKADANSVVYEGIVGGLGETNNLASATTDFQYRAADLQVTASAVPPEPETDTPFAVSWTTANTGNRDTTAFSEQVYFSTDAAVGSDVLLGTFALPAGLAAGATVDRIQNVSIPTSAIPVSGNYYLYIKTDVSSQADEGINEGNNIRFQPIAVRRLLRPDLIVTNITAPPAVFFGQTIQVQWTVKNIGLGPTNVPAWKDRILVNTTGSISAGAIIEVDNLGALNAGESYVATATVKVPRGITGSYQVVVATGESVGNTINEENTANNSLTRAMTINVPPLPDLIVTSVQAPDTGYAGTPFEVHWSVQNIGDAPAIGDRAADNRPWSWGSRVYLSRDTVLNPGQDRLIFSGGGLSTPLNPNDTHSASTLIQTSEGNYFVKLPADVSGQYYVFVLADYTNEIYEYNSENNNIGYDETTPGSPVTIISTPSDLIVPTQPTGPSSAYDNALFATTFTVQNQGAFTTQNTWTDGLYLSTDQIFDAGDTRIGSKPSSTMLAPGTGRLVEMNASVPPCFDGSYYLIAATDIGNSVFEYDPVRDAEANNGSPAVPIQLTSRPVDLVGSNLQFSPVPSAGQQLTVTWTESNTGVGAGPDQWYDRIVLSPSVGQPITLFQVRQTGSIAGGSSVARSQNVYLPAFMQGFYTISVETDNLKSLAECGAGEDNNTVTSAPFSVSNTLPDLVVDNVTVPAAPITAGQNFQISWTGRNAGGDLGPLPTSWNDAIYISSDQSLSNNDVYIGSSLNMATLAAGQTYLQTANVSSGNVPAGQYYILVITDNSRNIYEGPSNTVYENNNLTASMPITINSPDVDLQVVVNSVSAPAYAGQSVNVAWTVTNAGATATLGTTWTDYVILSRDSVIDSTDKFLSYENHTATTLAGGGSYSVTKPVTIPTGLTGLYRIFVITDYHKAIVENNDANNTSPAYDTDIQLAPPADLNVTNITVPAGQSPGESTVISWTVQNSGAFTAVGPWRDSVYLSTDQFWDAGDILLGQRNRIGTPLGVSQTEVETQGFSIPMIEEGNYYVIVRLDSQNRVRESDELNNIAVSVGQMPITIQGLTMGTPFTTTLYNGGKKLFKFLPPVDETVIVSLDGEDGNKNQLLSNFYNPASLSDFEFADSGIKQPDQENFIPNTSDGPYYSYVSHDYIPPSLAAKFDDSPSKTNGVPVPVPPQNITMTATVLPFSISAISPTLGGNAGDLTVAIRGAKFVDGAMVKLVGPDGAEILPRVKNIKPTIIRGLFDMKGHVAGLYDVVVTNPDGHSAALNNKLQIVNGGGSTIRQSAEGPQYLRVGTRNIRYTFTAANDGLNDAQAVPMVISLPVGAGYQIDAANFFDFPTELLPPGATSDMVPTELMIDGNRYIMLLIPILQARSSVNIGINIITPGIDTSFAIGFAVLPSIVDMIKSNSIIVVDPANVAVYRGMTRQPQSSNLSETSVNNCYIEFLRSLAFWILSQIPGEKSAKAGLTSAIATADVLTGVAFAGATGNADGVGTATSVGGYLLTLAEAAFVCAENALPLLALANATIALGGLVKQLLDCIGQTYIYCEYIRSHDPNEKIGPAGFGAEHFVGIKRPLEYRINFENVSTAASPAQKIYITDDLPATLDARTVRLKEVGFNDTRVIIPDNQAFYQSRFDIEGDANSLKADISAGLDIVNRRVTWTMTAIDPQTGERPNDPRIGLLPPDNEDLDGQGYAIFTAEATDTFPNRTAINNLATIYFDENEPIVTNTTANLLDSVVPASTMGSMPASSSSPDIPYSWSATDDTDGSGLANCEISVSTNGGGYTPLARPTDLTGSGVFAGQWGKHYAFHSICSDNAGNVEAAPTLPDAETTVVGGDTEADVSPRPNGNNGQVDAGDIGQIRRFAAKLDTDFANNELQRADTAPIASGGDGALTIADVIQTRRYAVGLDAKSDAAGPNALLPFTAGTAPGKLGRPAAARQIFATKLQRSLNKVIVGVQLVAQGDEAGVGFALNFDPAVLSNPVASLGQDATSGVLTVNTNDAATGRLGILIDKAPTDLYAAGNRQILLVQFDVVVSPPANTQLTFGSDPVASEVVDGKAHSLAATFSPATIELLSPTAAGVSVSGRAVTANGLPIKNVRVILRATNGTSRSALSNAFGYFEITDVPAGDDYVLSAESRGYHFAQRLLTVSDDVTGLDLVPEPE